MGALVLLTLLASLILLALDTTNTICVVLVIQEPPPSGIGLCPVVHVVVTVGIIVHQYLFRVGKQGIPMSPRSFSKLLCTKYEPHFNICVLVRGAQPGVT